MKINNVNENICEDSDSIKYDTCDTASANTGCCTDTPEIDFCLGIDFGTTNSCLSVWHNNKAIIIKDIDSDIIPTVIEISNNKKIVGKEAYLRKEIFDKFDKKESDNYTYGTASTSNFVIYEIKKLLGKKYSDINKNLSYDDTKLIAYNIDHDENDNIIIINKNSKKKYYPEEIAINIFMSFKTIANSFLSKKFPDLNINIKNAIISVPAYFNKNQRQIIKDSATNAGFDVKRLINEPTAAALCYGIGKNLTKSMNIIVFDFGGGTLDVSLLNIVNGMYEVLGSCGNNNLGGSDFDKRIMEYCIDQFILDNKLDKDIVLSDSSLQRLKYLAEQCKISLSDNLHTKIRISNFHVKDKHLDINISREIFNNICEDLISMTIKPINDLLFNCEMNKNEIDEIIMVGGMTRMPIIRYNIERFFNKDVNCSINPDNVVSIGAAIHGYMLTNKVTIDDKLLLIDRTSLSLGVETCQSIMDVIIPRGTIIPITKTKKYTTDTDYVSSIDIKIYEGERKFTKNNYLIGDFELSGIEPEKRGIPEIEIVFEIDNDGIIQIKAKDLNNPLNKKSIQISGNKQNLSKEQIDEIISSAKIMEEVDRNDRAKKESYVSLTDSSKRIIENVNSKDIKLDDNIKKAIIENVSEILEWLESNTYENISIEKYKELLHDYKINYSIYLLENVSKLNELETINDEKIKAVEIYDDEISTKKYYNEIMYVRNFIDEYNDINKQIKIISYMKKNVDNVKIDEITTLFENVYSFANDALINFFIDTTLDDDSVRNTCTILKSYDEEFKEKFNYINEVNIINKLVSKVKDLEDKLLNSLEENNLTDNEIVQVNNKLDTIIDFQSFIYKMNNGYITIDNNKIIEIVNKLDTFE